VCVCVCVCVCARARVCVCQSVDLVIQYTTHLPYYIVICGLSDTTVFFYIAS
jgi:hypothetical protein